VGHWIKKKKNNKIFMKIYIETSPTRFIVTPSSGSALIRAY